LAVGLLLAVAAVQIATPPLRPGPNTRR